MSNTTLKGQIIRILDTSTLVINLGASDGITKDSIFSILAEPETVIDPGTEEELGRVQIVKAKIKAQQVFGQFTIATSQWTDRIYKGKALGLEGFLGTIESKVTGMEKLNVAPEDIHPWQAISESPVRVGDFVETKVEVTEEDGRPEGPTKGADAGAEKKDGE